MNKVNVSVLASAARTATPTAVTANTVDLQYVHVIIDVTAINLTPSITITIDAYDDVSDTWYNLLTSAAITTVSNNVLKMGPGLPVTANVSANDAIPNQLRITSTHGDADSITYSIAINGFK